MAGLINSGSFPKALWPGVNAWYGEAYNQFPVEYTDLFDSYKSNKQFEEDVGISGFGLASVKNEGGPVSYDTMTQGFVTRFTHITYALGFMISKEMIDDDQYDVVGSKRARALALSMRQTKETVAANVYNRAFNSSYKGGDNYQMIGTAHPLVAGGTASNTLSVASTLSEAALEQACIDIARFTNDRGLKMSFMPESIIIPPELMFEAERIVKSQYRVGTANNDISALISMGKFPKGVKVNHYLSNTSPYVWFIRTNCPDGLKYWERSADSFQEDNDFDTMNAKFLAYSRYSFGWTDWRSVYGTTGS